MSNYNRTARPILGGSVRVDSTKKGAVRSTPFIVIN